jgi:hypothetical protein
MAKPECLRKVLHSITKDCHCKDNTDPYCILIEVILALGKEPRFLIQTKCVEKFKYELGKELDRVVEWGEAFNRWIDDGYAKKFEKEFNEDLPFEEIYSKVRPKK